MYEILLFGNEIFFYWIGRGLWDWWVLFEIVFKLGKILIGIECVKVVVK